MNETAAGVAVKTKERNQSTAHDAIGKMLVAEFCFQVISKKTTNFGERWLLRAPESARLEAQLGVYRICFHASEKCDGVNENAENNFPTNRAPHCFNTDEKSAVRAFLEKMIGKPVKTRAKRKGDDALTTGINLKLF